MRHVLIFISVLLLTSCFGNNLSFEKDYYERISGIKFPQKYEVLEAFDNDEWLTGIVLKVDSLTLRDFVVNNHFDAAKNLQDFHLYSTNCLTSQRPNFTSTNNIYFITKSLNKNNWTYVADLNSKRLWAEISYPDWGGQ
jgi:hypothetical protein